LDFAPLLESAPQAPAVFAIFAAEGDPYLAKTANLRRRLQRLLGPDAKLFSLRNVARDVRYELTGSALEANLLLYEWAKRYFGNNWTKRLRLRYPYYLRLSKSNPFPRAYVAARSPGAGAALGPFASRAQAEQFEARLLDLFQIRRCAEDLVTSPGHPGCMYGEMNLCLRPCQEAVSRDEYLAEVRRVEKFLSDRGEALLDSISSARDRAAANLDFEEAQRQHRRFEKVAQAWKTPSPICREIERLSGVVVLPASEPDSVRLQPVRAGWFQPPVKFDVSLAGQSLDARLREALDCPAWQGTAPVRNDHLAILAKWYYSSFREGEWIPAPVSYRKLVRAISSISRSSASLPTLFPAS
jgi:hypothetical protein